MLVTIFRLFITPCVCFVSLIYSYKLTFQPLFYEYDATLITRCFQENLFNNYRYRKAEDLASCYFLPGCFVCVFYRHNFLHWRYERHKRSDSLSKLFSFPDLRVCRTGCCGKIPVARPTHCIFHRRSRDYNIVDIDGRDID